MESTTSQRGILDPGAAAHHFRLSRYAPSADLAHLVERFWFVEWHLREPYTQGIVTHPCVNLAFEPHYALVFGVVTGRTITPSRATARSSAASSARAASGRSWTCPPLR